MHEQLTLFQKLLVTKQSFKHEKLLNSYLIVKCLPLNLAQEF